MTMSRVTKLFAVVLAGVLAGAVQAQTWTAEQTAVWEASSATWERDKNKDSGWITDSTHADVSAWGMEYPAPRGRDSLTRWAQHMQATGSIEMYELAPHRIVVVGDTALAHYHYTMATKNAEGKNETTHGRCSDTLIRDSGKWIFLGWSCSDEPKPR